MLSLDNELWFSVSVLETVGKDTDPNMNETDSAMQLSSDGSQNRCLGLSSEGSDLLVGPLQGIWAQTKTHFKILAQEMAALKTLDP